VVVALLVDPLAGDGAVTFSVVVGHWVTFSLMMVCLVIAIWGMLCQISYILSAIGDNNFGKLWGVLRWSLLCGLASLWRHFPQSYASLGLGDL
jgi:hypothetical protein